MAKSKSFFGLRSGSTKSHTFSVLEGQQITKDRVSQVSNPRTEQQATQRMKMSAVTNFYRGLSSILDHSFEGVAYGNKSRQYFMKLALSSNYAIAGIEKNVKNFIPLNLPVSTGSMKKLEYTFSEGKPRFVLPEALGAMTDTNRATVVKAIMDALNVNDGQLTFILVNNGVVDVKRIVLDPAVNIEDDFTWIAEHANITAGNAYIQFNNVADAFAVISSEFINGKWCRSTQNMLVSPAFTYDIYSYVRVESAKRTYMDKASNVINDRYLNEGESNPMAVFNNIVTVTPANGTIAEGTRGSSVSIGSNDWGKPLSITIKLEGTLEEEPVLVAGGAANGLTTIVDGDVLEMNISNVSSTGTSFVITYKGLPLVTVNKGV